jgi:tRNA(fMet)-specific endonuclease VapC
LKSLLDTNIWVDYLRAQEPAVGRIQRASPVDFILSSVVVAELRYGAEKSTHKAQNHKRIDLLEGEMVCAPFGAGAARRFGRLRTELESRGAVVGPYDMMIAAHALDLGCVLVTDNVDEFRRVRGLEIQSWRKPPSRRGP